MKTVAALDLGTNSFLCLVAEGSPQGIHKVISDEVEIVRLGEGVEKNKCFSAAALQRSKKALTRFRSIIDQHQVQQVKALATSAARDVSNSDLLFKLGEELNIPIEVISGDREAQLTFSGAMSGAIQRQGLGLVIDIGGGSTELILGQAGGQVLFAQSLDIGGVRLTEKFISRHPIHSSELKTAEQFVSDQVDKHIEQLRNLKTNYAIAVAGTPTALVKAIKGRFLAEEVEGHYLSLEDLNLWLEKLASRTLSQRVQDLNVDQGRADILPIGVLILKIVIEKMQLPGVFVSTRGVRYGLASELLEL
jgi:exopolyphosphatase/guanosine-5'-triphosphate,3'-diphosphate pyrophosphatase